MNRLVRAVVLLVSLIGLGVWGGNANAAVCTSLSNGTWNTAGRWSCGHAPAAGDTVVIAHNITLNTAPLTIAGLTVNSGVSLADDNNNRRLTITGDVTINGTVDTGGGRIELDITGASSILSGSGTFTDARLYLSGASPTVAAGSTLNFTAGSRIYTGRTATGVNALGSVLTINGTINSTVTTASTTFLRLYANSTVVGATGAINAAPSTFRYQNATATLTNNGSVSVQTVTGNSATGSIWTNAAGASLEVSVGMLTTGTLNASAAGNTVNYTGAAQTGKVTTYSNLTLSGSGAKTFATAPTVNGVLSMEGTATVTVTTGVVTYGASATLQYNTASARTVSSEEWVSPFAATGGVIIAGSGAITLNADKTLAASVPLTINGGATLANGAFALTVAGDFTQNGTFTAGTGVVTLNGGTAVQTISGAGPLGFANLTVSNTGGITLARNVTVTSAIIGAVTLTNTCPTDYTLTSNGGATVQHSCPASVVNAINLADPSPTSAATVAWTVTFNTSVTGVDASAFSLVPTGVAGAYITTVTGSGTTWTVTANTGIGAGSLGLNQTGPGSVVPTLTGTFTGQVYTITATPALAEYRMDEASWNGTANEAADSGTGGFPGTAAGLTTTRPTTSIASPAIAGSPGTCRYGVFNRANKDYIALPAGFPNLAAAAGDFSITAWINVANNTLPGQRIIVDDQNNTSPGGWGFSVGETATAGGLRFYYRQTSTYILDTAPIPSNQWLFVALSVHLAAGANASTATIYAYNTGGTLVTSNTGTFTWTAGSDPGPLSIGGETNASGEGTNAFGFGGNIDELRVYQKTLSQAAVVALAAQTHACPVNVPDHLVIQSSGSGLTCAASTLTVVACQDASCATPYTLGVSGTLSATGAPTVNWDGTTGGAAGAGFVIPNGSSSVTKNMQVATAGSVVFGVSSATPTPTNATTCNFGSPACTFTANSAGFIFSDTSTPGNAYTIPAQVSGIATPTLYLRAVQASTTNPAVCTPAIIGQTTAVNMGYACNNPATCQSGNLTTINATPVAPAGTAVTLTFDANGSAPISARYDDVGQITLNANKTVTPFGGGTAITLNGSSNAYVVAPHHFGFSGITAAPIRAGTTFSATVTAYNGLGSPTATGNFGKETAPEGVTLSFVKYQPTGAGAVNGSFSGSVGAFNSGSASGANLAWSEVGTIDLTATLAGGSYLGSSLTATGSTGTAGAVGRFIPDHFDTVVTEACVTGAFSYSGQPFTVEVTAMNGAVTPAKTVNYDGTANTSPNFAKAVTLSDASGATVGSLAPAAVAATAFTAGVAAPTPAYTFTSATTVPTTIGLRAVDSDGVTSSGHAEGSAVIRSGRLRLSNAFGSEKADLAMQVQAHYWSGKSWVLNNADSCTSLPSSAFYLSGAPPGVTASAVTLAGGAGTLTLTKPSPAATGSFDLAANLGLSVSDQSCLSSHGGTAAGLPWLRSRNGSCAVTYDRDPSARATFGIYSPETRKTVHVREQF